MRYVAICLSAIRLLDLRKGKKSNPHDNNDEFKAVDFKTTNRYNKQLYIIEEFQGLVERSQSIGRNL